MSATVTEGTVATTGLTRVAAEVPVLVPNPEPLVTLTDQVP